MLDPLRKTTARNSRASRTQAPAPSGTLLRAEDFTYLGAFRLPPTDYGQPGQYLTFGYGGRNVAYNPANDSLFMTGHEYSQAIAEVAIPALVGGGTIGSFNEATLVQSFFQPLPVMPNNTLLRVPPRTLDIGDLMVAGSTLVGTVYDYYDGNVDAVGSHFIFDSLTMSAGNLRGYYAVAPFAGRVAGTMFPVPAAWQARLGYPYITGQGNIAIIGRCSSGPGAYGFNPADFTPSTLAGVGQAPSTVYLDYPIDFPLGPYQFFVSPLECGSGEFRGGAFIPGTDTILFTGRMATNYVTYISGGGPTGLNNEYKYIMWFYDANDFLRVKNGTKLSYEIVPYDAWNLTVPFVPALNALEFGGACFDPATNRLFLSFMYADNASLGALPVIGVWHVAVPPSGSAANPRIGAAAVTTTEFTAPGHPKTGPVTANTPVLLTAGNVYPATAGASITGVAFYRDANANGTLEVGTDVFLGNATQQGSLNSGHNWELTVPTTGLTSGSYTLFARATDSGNRTVTRSFTLEIA